MMNEDQVKKGAELSEEELDGVAGGQNLGVTITKMAPQAGQAAPNGKQGLRAGITLNAIDPTNKDNQSRL